LFLKFGDVFDWHRESEAGSVYSVFMGLVVGDSVCVMCSRMKGCQDGPDETLRVGGVCYTNFKFRDAVEGKAAAMTIKVIELFGQVGSDLLEVQVLGVVNVVYRRCEEAWNSLLAFGNIANLDGVDTNLYPYRSTTHKSLTKCSNFVNVFRLKISKIMMRL